MTVVAVIVDIVRSRQLADRAGAQEAIRACFAAADEVAEPQEQLWATVGDEFQVVYRTVRDAVRVTTSVRLTLPPEVDCRFGLGVGDVRVVDAHSDGHAIQDGSGWWEARRAIDTAAKRQRHGDPYLRSWLSSADGGCVEDINAYLMLRDHVITRMKARERRLTAGYLQGRTQMSLARQEGLSQSAVSQALLRSGATALVNGQRLLLDSSDAEQD